MTTERDAEQMAVDDARGSPRHRLCAVTRTVRPIDELIRFVKGPDGSLVPDLRNKLPGRGVWVSGGRSRVEEAIRGKVFARSLKTQVAAEAGLADLVDQLLVKHALGALSFTNKAGALVLGFDRVREAIAAHKVIAVVHASDASPGGVHKLGGNPTGELADSAEPKTVMCFSNEQLSLALGRSNVVHAALFEAQASRNFIEQTERLLRFRSN